MMKLPRHQRGLSAIGALVILMVAVFFGTCAIKLAPLYVEHTTIKGAVESVVQQAEAGDIQVNEIRSRVGKLFQVNMIEVISHRDIKISTKEGVITVDARYERRVPLMFNVDVVLKFEEMLFSFSRYSKSEG